MFAGKVLEISKFRKSRTGGRVLRKLGREGEWGEKVHGKGKWDENRDKKCKDK
jgi:hypothetical protein